MKYAENARLNERQYGDWLRGINMRVGSKSKGLGGKEGSNGPWIALKAGVGSGGLLEWKN